MSSASKAFLSTDSDREEPSSIILACGADYSNSMLWDANERKYVVSFFAGYGVPYFMLAIIVQPALTPSLQSKKF
jgi:hypothetical protein